MAIREESKESMDPTSDAIVDAPVEKAIKSAEEDRCPFHQKVKFFSVVLLLVFSIICSAMAVTGMERGWFKWHKKNVMREDSPYAGLIKYVFMMNPDPNNVDVGFVNAIEFQLPQHVPFDVDVGLGWYKLTSNIQIIGGDPVAPYLQVLGRSLTPEDYHDDLERIFGEGRSSLVEDYKGDRLAGKITGAVCVAALGISALAGSAIIVGLISSWCTGGPPNYVLGILSKAHFLAVFLFTVYITELVVASAGCYRDLDRNPVVQKGYIPWPDWAWILAMLGASAWMVVWMITRKNKECINVTLLNLPIQVPTKQSWNIPAGLEENPSTASGRRTGDVEIV